MTVKMCSKILVILYYLSVSVCASSELATVFPLQDWNIPDVLINSSNEKIVSNKSFMPCTGDKELHFCLPCNEGPCKCGTFLNDILHCTNGRVSVLDCFCVTYNEQNDLLEVGSCLFNCERVKSKDDQSDLIYHLIDYQNISKLNKFMCGDLFNRTGTLCGKCEDGLYSLVYSYDMSCVECPNGRSNWWKFMLVAFLPLTFFYFAVLFLGINATSSHLHGFVFYGQILTMPAIVRVIYLAGKYNPQFAKGIKFIGSFYGIWNLDFFRLNYEGICLGTDTLLSLALQLIVGMYPLLLMLLSYLVIDLYSRNFRPLVIIWKPFNLVFSLFHGDIRTSLVDAFATFFLLSHVKFLSISGDLLTPVRVYQISKSSDHLNYSWRLFYDADIQYFGKYHLPYAIIAITIFVLFVFLPTIILMLYPFAFFQKLLGILPFRKHILHTFVDSFQGCYKDGTEPGTRDCRWFASIFFIARFLIFITGAANSNSMYFIINAMIFVVITILLITVQPFKANVSRYNDINAVFLMLLALLYVGVIGKDMAGSTKQEMIKTFVILVIPSLVIPLLYISAIILYWIFSHRKFGLELVRQIRAFRQGYHWNSN